MIYLLAVVIAALYLGRGPSLLAAVLSVLAFDFFFVRPLDAGRHRFGIPADLSGLLVVGLVISNLAVRVREQAEAAERREAQTAELYALSRDLAVAVDLDTILQAVLTHVSQTFGREVVVLLPDSAAIPSKPRALSPGFALNENELAVATWAFSTASPPGAAPTRSRRPAFATCRSRPLAAWSACWASSRPTRTIVSDA